MHHPPLVCAVLLTLAVAACDDTPSVAPDGPTLAFRVETFDGKPASDDELRELRSVVSRRLDAAGHTGLGSHARTQDGMFTVRIHKTLAPKIDEIATLIARPGTLEFRIEADAATTRKNRELREASNGLVSAPPGFAWMARTRGGTDVLVETPEKPLRAAVNKLVEKGAAEDSPELVQARTAYDHALRDSVFTGEDLARVEASPEGKAVVYFALGGSRKAGFEAFTEKHVHEVLAIVVDGKVFFDPVIVSKLPGEGILEGGGQSGFTRDEARDLAAALRAGALPVRLVRVPPPEKK